MKRPLSQAELELKCSRFNREHPLGSPVVYHPVIGEPAGKQTRTRSEAYIMSGHTAVLFIEDHAGCVALDAIGPATHLGGELRADLESVRKRYMEPAVGYLNGKMKRDVDQFFAQNRPANESTK